MRKGFVALLAYNHFDLTLKRLYELMRHCRGSLDCVYVINNGSTDETHNGLKWWKTESPMKVKEIPLETNLGFLLGANYGLRTISKEASPDDVIILLSNDVQVMGNFVPETEQAGSKKLLGGKLLHYDTGWNKFGDKLFPYLEGWMLAATVGAWKSLDYFDERFAPNDYEDIDLTTSALSKGFDLEVIGSGKLFHQGGGTLGYSPERLEQTNRNKQKFQEKWVK